MDRLFSMVERWRNIEDNRDTVKMTLEAKGDATGDDGRAQPPVRLEGGPERHPAGEPITSEEVIQEMIEDD